MRKPWLRNISWLCQNQTANRGGPGIRNNLGLFTLMTLLFPPIKSSSNLTIFMKILHSRFPLQNKKIYVIAKIFKDYFFIFSIWFNISFFFLEWVSPPPRPCLPHCCLQILVVKIQAEGKWLSKLDVNLGGLFILKGQKIILGYLERRQWKR